MGSLSFYTYLLQPSFEGQGRTGSVQRRVRLGDDVYIHDGMFSFICSQIEGNYISITRSQFLECIQLKQEKELRYLNTISYEWSPENVLYKNYVLV